ncbi:MAG: CapA family protein [Oligoflexia bacterium]|nr:CapA family protein [Oligoflexia bacterium]
MKESAQGLSFSRACEAGAKLTIAAVGDVLLHGPLHRQALRETHGHESLWLEARPLLEGADLAYANFEGPAAHGVDSAGRAVTDPGRVFDDRVYTSYPQFNYHPFLITDLLASGIDVVSTANNHSLDRKSLGVDRTIDNLRSAGLPFTGTRKRGEEASWHVVTRANGFAVAWLACTYATNGIPDRDAQVLDCYRHKSELLALVRTLSEDRAIDAVIVTPHWGVEYQHTPETQEVMLAQALIEAGATAVIGSHPHVLQPWQKHVTADGREGFIIYSLGNFVSGQQPQPRRATIVLHLGLTRTWGGKAHVNGVRYVPATMTSDNGYFTLSTWDRRKGTGGTYPLITGIFGEKNLAQGTDPIVTNPECY